MKVSGSAAIYNGAPAASPSGQLTPDIVVKVPGSATAASPFGDFVPKILVTVFR